MLPRMYSELLKIENEDERWATLLAALCSGAIEPKRFSLDHALQLFSTPNALAQALLRDAPPPDIYWDQLKHCEEFARVLHSFATDSERSHAIEHHCCRALFNHSICDLLMAMSESKAKVDVLTFFLDRLKISNGLGDVPAALVLNCFVGDTAALYEAWYWLYDHGQRFTPRHLQLLPSDASRLRLIRETAESSNYDLNNLVEAFSDNPEALAQAQKTVIAVCEAGKRLSARLSSTIYEYEDE